MDDNNNNKGNVYQATPVYAEVATEEQLLAPFNPATDLTAPVFSAREEFCHIAGDLTWTDTFFEDDEDVVAVFDLDYDSMESFYTSLGWVGFGLSLIYAPIFAIATIALVPCFLKRNVQWAVRAKHVAVTRDGIRFVQNRRNCGWGLACMDVGKTSKTVPFDKITDCDIVEPAGNECCCVRRVLFSVRVDTASSSKERHELVLAGLQNPHGFKKLVWAMKRAQQQQNHQQPNALEMMRAMPALGDSQNNGDGVALLLREIRDELRQNNETLQAMKAQQGGIPVEKDRFV